MPRQRKTAIAGITLTVDATWATMNALNTCLINFSYNVDLLFVENSSNPKKIMLAKHVTLTIKTVFIVFRRITLLEEF